MVVDASVLPAGMGEVIHRIDWRPATHGDSPERPKRGR